MAAMPEFIAVVEFLCIHSDVASQQDQIRLIGTTPNRDIQAGLRCGAFPHGSDHIRKPIDLRGPADESEYSSYYKL